jgi:hypothetical protein
MQEMHRFSLRRSIVTLLASLLHGTAGIRVMTPGDSAHTAESSESSQPISTVPFVTTICALNMCWVEYTDTLNLCTANALIK